MHAYDGTSGSGGGIRGLGGGAVGSAVVFRLGGRGGAPSVPTTSLTYVGRGWLMYGRLLQGCGSYQD